MIGRLRPHVTTSVALFTSSLKALWYNDAMSMYTYSAGRKDGSVVEGERDAADLRALATLIKSEGMILLRAEEKRKVALGGTLMVRLNKIVGRLSHINVTDKMFFTRNLAVMITAGLPIGRALTALADETPKQRFRDVIADIHSSVQEGKSLADSMKKH